MKLRERFPFDDPPPFWVKGIKYFGPLAATPDRRTWWLEAGRNGGCRFLAHFAEFGVYVANRLHAKTLVACEDSTNVRRLLQRAADAIPITEMVVPEQDTVRWPTYDLPRRSSSTLPLPGFVPSEADWDEGQPPAFKVHRHEQGWFTRTERALPLAPPAWAPDARAWDIREGIYIAFADGTYRLVPRREYYDFANTFSAAPIARQGDLLVFDQRPAAIEQNGSMSYAKPWTNLRAESFYCILGDDSGDGKEESLDRHVLRPAGLPGAGKFGTVIHSEHEPLELPEGWQTIVLAPGTSRPFSRQRGID